MSEAVARSALSNWGYPADCPMTLFAQRENYVVRLEPPRSDPVVMRVHRAGYRSEIELRSELAQLEALAAGGVNVPRPVCASDGSSLSCIGGRFVSVITMLPGTPLGRSGVPLALADRQGSFRRLGAALARVHDVTDAWKRPDWYQRKAWNREGLLGATPHWGRFWEAQVLGCAERQRLSLLRDIFDDLIQRTEGRLSYGPIHADTVGENVLVSADGIGLIDWDDCGDGFRLFDLATALCKHVAEPDYDTLRAALLAGYDSLRPLSAFEHRMLDHWVVLRLLTYVGWIDQRTHEPEALARGQRIVKAALDAADTYLFAGDV